MNFIVCILASVVSHLLVIGFLYFTHPFTNTEPNVFKVDIVVPEGTRKLPNTEALKSAIKKIRPPLIIKKQPLVTYRRRPPEKELMPQTMFGTGTDDSNKSWIGSNNSSSTGKEKNASRKEENKSLSSPSKEQGLVQQDKDGTLAPPSYLFDKKTIEKFAREGSAAKKGLTFDTSEFKHRGYMRMLKERIEDVWKYPAEAARQGISGDLYMKFSIKKDGKIAEIELLRTSGHRELDEAAMKAVKNAEPFWPLPDDWDKDVLEIKGHFIYVFGNTLVM